ncbi:hypothetical protein [Clostridium sp. 001]|uniref:hypothetical protein n=1 Tax=Clostridium sp. 001 TaxID=1970093 RepID=UPI001C2C1CF2|nr:hypothetical protein [Clostridium sp. 001]QXE20469.1 hypothetical protein B5S50_17385 [Clostridium sp. 001]
MAISKNSRRVQFTLNADKEKEKAIINFLDSSVNPNSTIKEILYSVVSNSNSQLLKVTHSEITQSQSKPVEVSKSELLDNNVVTQSEEKLVEVSDEIGLNELEELKKFIT